MKKLSSAIALTLLLAACGGSDSSSSTTSVAPTTVAPVASSTTSAPTSAPPAGDLVAAEGDMVAVHYVGTLDDGTQFDSSRDRNSTLDFTIGAGQMIAGFDAGVRGMEIGQVKTIRIEPADAYGDYDPSLIVEVAPDQVPENVTVGMQLRDPFTGQPVVVTEVTADLVKIDTNHPLAGEALTFEIEMMSITR